MSIDRKKAFSTRSIHTGEPADPSTQAVEPSLVLSTNFVFDPDSADFSAETLNEKTPNVYARWSSPTVRALEVKLADLEDGEDALCFASGMGAISALILGTLHSGDHLVLSDVCYAGVAELVRNTLPGFGIEVTTANFSDLASVTAAVRPNTRIQFCDLQILRPFQKSRTQRERSLQWIPLWPRRLPPSPWRLAPTS
jgi:O-acetylhomoserine/O-acetylserine sulfhydrylase-like pyridoxal-dependent enzyme